MRKTYRDVQCCNTSSHIQYVIGMNILNQMQHTLCFRFSLKHLDIRILLPTLVLLSSYLTNQFTILPTGIIIPLQWTSIAYHISTTQ